MIPEENIEDERTGRGRPKNDDLDTCRDSISLSSKSGNLDLLGKRDQVRGFGMGELVCSAKRVKGGNCGQQPEHNDTGVTSFGILGASRKHGVRN